MDHVGNGGTPTTLRLTVSSEGLSYPLVVDPSFTATGSLTAARSDPTATLLPNGTALIAAGGSLVLTSLSALGLQPSATHSTGLC